MASVMMRARCGIGRSDMRNPFGTMVLGVFVGTGIALPAAAQAPASGGSPVVAHPTYTSIPMEIMVNRPAAEVWKRVGKYCDVAEWLQVPAGCKILAGKDGEVGAVRSVGNGEVLVSKTEFSYAYAQTPREGMPFNLY